MKIALFVSVLALASPLRAHPGTGTFDGSAPGYPEFNQPEAAPPWDNFSDTWAGHGLPMGGDADVPLPRAGQIAVLRAVNFTIDATTVSRLAATGADALIFDADAGDFSTQTAAYAGGAQKLRTQGNRVPAIVFSASDAAGVTRAWQTGNKLKDGDLLQDGDKLLLFADPGFDGGPDIKGFSRQNIISASVFDVDLAVVDSFMNAVGAIRRFKGVRPLPPASKPQTIVIDGKFKEWKAVAPEFRDSLGETDERNDLQSAKIARDENSVAFTIRARAAFALDAKNALQLWIDADQNGATGWHGYEFSVALNDSSAETAPVLRFDGAKWVESGTVPLAFNGNEIELSIPHASIGLKVGQSFDFHWRCGAQSDEKAFETGENAPDGTFNFRFVDKVE